MSRALPAPLVLTPSVLFGGVRSRSLGKLWSEQPIGAEEPDQ